MKVAYKDIVECSTVACGIVAGFLDGGIVVVVDKAGNRHEVPINEVTILWTQQDIASSKCPPFVR